VRFEAVAVNPAFLVFLPLDVRFSLAGADVSVMRLGGLDGTGNDATAGSARERGKERGGRWTSFSLT
jgi:hypothetical protein